MNILLPTDDQFVENVAKAIGRDRLFREAADLLETAIGVKLPDSDAIDARFDSEFEYLWHAKDDECVWNRESYRADAVVAINKINLLLLTMPT